LNIITDATGIVGLESIDIEGVDLSGLVAV